MKELKSPRVFFNASVILAGLKNPNGGSGKLLEWTVKKKIKGVISKIIQKEVIRHAEKLKKEKKELEKEIPVIFSNICLPPKKAQVEMYKNYTVDLGDAHVLASSIQEKCDFLVSLDKKHILILQDKIREISIVTPKQLIELFGK